jgi:hypothetical protein
VGAHIASECWLLLLLRIENLNRLEGAVRFLLIQVGAEGLVPIHRLIALLGLV